MEYLKSIIEKLSNLDIDDINQKINNLYTQYKELLLVNKNINTLKDISSQHLKNFDNLYSRKEKKLSGYFDNIKKDLDSYKDLISEVKNMYNEIKKRRRLLARRICFFIAKQFRRWLRATA